MTTNRKLTDIGKPTTFMAIDASTNSLAFSIFRDGRLIKYGKVNINGTDTFYKAGDAGRKSVGFFKAFNVEAVIIEGVIFSKSPKVAISLALVQGAIISAAQIAGVKIVKSISPMEWQAHIGTRLLTTAEKAAIMKKNPGHTASWYKSENRKTRKQKTIDTVNKLYKLQLTDDDIADAVGLGTYVSDRWNAVFNAQV